MTELQEALVRYRPELVRRARQVAGAAAEDLVHDTVVRALRFQHTYAAGTNVRAWLHQVLAGVVSSARRRRRLEQRVLDEAVVSEHVWWPAHSGAWSADYEPPSSAVLHALDALPPQFREAVLLAYVDERTTAQAAEELQVPIGTVLSRTARGRAMLRRLLHVHPQGRAKKAQPSTLGQGRPRGTPRSKHVCQNPPLPKPGA